MTEQQSMGFAKPLPDIADRLYAAGFFDGEGSVFISAKADGVLQLRAQISLTHLPTLQWFRGLWGGTVRALPRRNARWKPAWQWQLSTRQALPFLRAIQPFAQVKRESIDNGIAFLERASRARRLPVEQRELDNFAARSRTLNQRGPASGD